jgi:hypothetical protein
MLVQISYGFFVSMALFSGIGLVVCVGGLGVLPALNRLGLPVFPGTFGRVFAAVLALAFAAEVVHSLWKLRMQIRRHARPR